MPLWIQVEAFSNIEMYDGEKEHWKGTEPRIFQVEGGGRRLLVYRTPWVASSTYLGIWVCTLAQYFSVTIGPYT